MFNFLVFGLYRVLSELEYTCDESICPESSLGDGICDKSCMLPECHYDSSFFSDDGNFSFESSDCFSECYCNQSMLTNGKCDPECDTYQCGYDLGECGYCTSGCFKEDLVSGTCKSQCISDSCVNKNIDCNCAPGCFFEDFKSNICKEECQDKNCLKYHQNPCFYESCYPECYLGMIGDGYCHSYCNLPECNFESGDCDCNQGCSDTSSECLTNDTYTDPCDTIECGYKDGKCGYCASGCFEYHLGDGICQPECNTTSCKNDYGDCGCATGCSFIFNTSISSFFNTGSSEECSAECLVFDCKFGIDFCTNELLVKSAVLNYLVYKNRENILNNYYCELFGCSSEEMSRYLNGTDICAEESLCRYKECLYCMGQVNKTFEKCLKQSVDECLICDSAMIENICYEDLVECPNGYEDQGKLVGIFGNSHWCLREATYYSKSNYKEIFVNSSVSTSGNGSLYAPVKTLYNALVNLYAAYSKIYLVNKVIDFYIDDSESALVTDKYNPLKTKTGYLNYELWIIGNYSESEKTIIYWKDNLKISPFVERFYMKNIELIGKYVIKNDCTIETCFYCPNVIYKDSAYQDNGLNIDLDVINYNYSTNCYDYYSVDVFNFSKAAYIENVDFKDFRYQFNSFIRSSGTLELKNVNFYKMQAKALGSIILLECNSFCINNAFELYESLPSFTYNQGVVLDIGAGYNDAENVETGSFIICNSYENIFILNVTFSYNFVYHNLRSPDKGYLIYSKNHFGTIVIEDCEFENNYANYLVYIDVRSLEYLDLRPIKAKSIAYSQQHFFMNNIKITGTYSSHGMINYLMWRVVHNIKILNLSIFNSVAGGSGILVFVNEKSLENSDIIGEYKLINTGDMIDENINIFIEPRLLYLEKIIIMNSNTGKYCIIIEKFPNAFIKDVSIFNIAEGGEKEITTIISLFADSGRYFSFIDADNEVQTLNCYQMVIVSDSVNLSIDSLMISSINCPTQELTLGMYLYKITGKVNITTLTLTDLQAGAKSGVALAVIDSNTININDMKIHNVSNTKESILKFDNCKEIIIDSANISNIKSNYTSTFVVTNSEKFSLSNFLLQNISTDYSNGGCLSLLTGNKKSSFRILSGNFIACSSNDSKGGAIYLDSLTRLFPTLLQIYDIGVFNCNGDEGSAIFISNTVTFSLDENSELVGLMIFDNDCKSGGVISDYHYSGNLKIDGLEMDRNTRGVYVLYSNTNLELIILNTKIYAQESLSSAFEIKCLKHGSSVLFENVEIFNSNQVAIEAYNIEVLIEQLSIFDANKAIYFNDKVECRANNLKIMKNLKELIHLENNSKFYCNNSDFTYNNNTIITASSNSNFSFENSNFVSNTLNSGHLFSILSAEDVESILINCQIYSNTINLGSLVYLFSSILTLKNSSIVENKGLKTGIQIIYLFNSKLSILNSRLQLDGLAEYGAFFYAEAESKVFAKNTVFENSQSKIGSIYGSHAEITINTCIFSGNSGGDIYTIESNLYIKNSIFESSLLSSSNTGAVQIKNNNETIIEETIFKNISALLYLNSLAHVYDESSKKLEILNCTFLGSDNLAMALYVKENPSVLIENSFFFGLNTPDSALTFLSNEKMCELRLKNSKITKNWSLKNGGGLYSENYNIIIENTEISFNTAKDSGGGIFYKSPTCLNCGIYLLGNTKIFNNSCNNDGGALKWENYKPYIEDDVLVFNNSATYGSDFASTPIKFGLLDSILTSNTVLTKFLNVPPGKKFTDIIQVYIFDIYEQVVTTENSITAVLLANETNDSLVALSGITTFKAYKGVLNITDFILTGVPGSIVYIKLKSDNLISSIARNIDSVYLDSVYIEVEFRNCSNGEQIQATACIDCVAGKYTLKASENCIDCPNGGNCTGGDAIIVKNGFWRSSLDSDIIYACDVFDACLKGSEINELGNCSTGYFGVLCKSCVQGYSKTSNGICTKCPNQKNNFIRMILLCFAIIFISYLLVKTTLTSAFSPKSLHSIYIKIFTNYLQLVFIATQFDLEWPSFVTEFFNIQRITASVSNQLFSLDCYIALHNTEVIENVYYSKIIMISALPIIIAIISYSYWIIHSNIKEYYKFLKREVYTTIVVLFFLVYPTIVKFMFSNFSCMEIDKMKSYLNENPSIECWDQSHKKYSFIVAVPSIILWAIGVPTVLLILMTKNRRRLHLDYYRVVFGFLYNGYKQSRFYWEINIMYRKILLITISVFKISQARALQALNLILVLLASIYLHHSFKPYNSNELNNMEMQALNIAAITIYFGLYYLSKSISMQIQILLFIFIILGNSYFILYWIYYMSKALADVIIKFFPNFRSIFKRGDAFDEEFYREEIVREGVFFKSIEGKKTFTFINLKNEIDDKHFKYKSMEEAYLDVAKRDIEKNF